MKMKMGIQKNGRKLSEYEKYVFSLLLIFMAPPTAQFLSASLINIPYKWGNPQTYFSFVLSNEALYSWP